MFEQARCCVEVTAGLIPGRPDAELTKQFWITSAEWNAAEDQMALLHETWDQAVTHAKDLVDPRGLNFVSVSWVYF